MNRIVNPAQVCEGFRWGPNRGGSTGGIRVALTFERPIRRPAVKRYEPEDGSSTGYWPWGR